jgi:hypothetical protein
MPTPERFLEQVASSISEMRDTVQNDLDRCYSLNGSIVLDQLTERLADAFAAHYPRFKRDAFLTATHVPQGSGRLQAVDAMNSANRSDGFMDPRRFRGRSLRLRANASMSDRLSPDKSGSVGMF